MTSTASVLNTITKKTTSSDPKHQILQECSRKWYQAHRQKYWSEINRWEQTHIQEEEGTMQLTRGELIDIWVTDLIAICADMEFEIDNEQSLRDDVFDYVRSASYK